MTLRTCDVDGTHHFSHVKKLALSGRQYLHAVNEEVETTSPMLVGTATHFLTLGPRPGAKPLAFFHGDRRSGKAWESFCEENPDAERLTAPEWKKAQAIADALREDPVAQARLLGARFEVPLVWEENGLKFSTSGVDIVCPDGSLCDLKTTSSTFPDAWTRQAFKMLYPQQLAFYRRGARANGLDPTGLYLLGVETRGPYEVVELEMTEEMIDFADRTVTLWIEKLKVYTDACPAPEKITQWPGYAQSSVPMVLPAFLRGHDDDDEEEAA